MDTNTANGPVLEWGRKDFERRFGFFKAGAYTNVNKLLSILIAACMTGVFFFAISHMGKYPHLKKVTEPFLRPDNLWTTVPCTLFFFWAIAMIFVKGRKLKFQSRALKLSVIPEDPDFFLNETTAKPVMEDLRGLVDHPRHFILLKRIDASLSSLQNIGEVRDVAAVMKNQSENDEEQVASSYILPNAMVWAVPILGFIGTVLGLSSAIGKFADTISSAEAMNSIKTNLTGVTSGLSTAFETTLVALVFALLIQLYLNYMQSRESEFLDECNDYCHVHVISKLRLNKSMMTMEQMMQQMMLNQAQVVAPTAQPVPTQAAVSATPPAGQPPQPPSY